MEEKILVETGYEYLTGEGVIALEQFSSIRNKFVSMAEYLYTDIEIQEHLPYEIEKYRRERHKQIYRGKITKDQFDKLKKEIPQDNPYKMYIKTI